MIVRIATEGQYRVDSGALDRIHDLDDRLMAATANDDEAEFHRLLHELADVVRGQGQRVPAQEIVESDLVVPPPDTSIQEARKLFEAGERAM